MGLSPRSRVMAPRALAAMEDLRAALLNWPGSLAVDSVGNLFIADLSSEGFTDSGNRVRKVSADGIINLVAGKIEIYGCCLFRGDGEPATGVQLSGPIRIAVDAAGNLLITEPLFGRVRKVSPDGIISTVAGNRPEASKVIPRPAALGLQQMGDGLSTRNFACRTALPLTRTAMF